MSDRPTAVVTGASSGIGFELTKLLARDRHDVVLVARSGAPMRELADELEERYGVAAQILVKDLASPGASREIVSELRARDIEVDVLVNAAGFTQYSPFISSDEGKMLELLEVNMVALTHLTRLLLPGMVSRARGLLINMASNAAFQPGPLMACYYASKAFVLSFSIALGEELRGTGVTVTALCPGPYASTFQARAGMEDSKLVANRRLPSAAEIAEWGYAKAKKGRPLAVHGARWQAVAFGTRLLPRHVAARMVLRAQRPVGV